ncbi:MAG: zeta toxin family protein [Egibacteraceae bacterium]
MDPLRNAEGRARGRRHVTVRDGKAGLPYSKGLMATSVMAAGLPPYEAFHVEDRVMISSAELRQIAALVLEEEVGPPYADNYRLWQQAQERKVPLIVLIGGATGVGKSTVATMVANRLGIVRIVSTDAVREVMRGIFTKEMMPSLHTSSLEVTTLLKDPPGDADPVIAGFRHQAHAVAVGLAQLLQRALIEGTDLIVEGAHLVPGFLRLPPREAAIVVPTVISIDDRQVHRSHFVARAADTRRGGDRRYLNHFDDIRKIQDYVHALALEHGVPVISSPRARRDRPTGDGARRVGGDRRAPFGAQTRAASSPPDQRRGRHWRLRTSRPTHHGTRRGPQEQ